MHSELARLVTAVRELLNCHEVSRGDKPAPLQPPPEVVPQAAGVTAIDDIGKASEVAPKAAAPTVLDTAAEANASAVQSMSQNSGKLERVSSPGTGCGS